ncbi:Hcp family type VI secretion system effector [Maridesulfovibrio frigidus]|uniref:Hcp family type VI secretion system effector n=1 Tax=Maridesulfovibrio frigidus TaxID=340956 RepID=UPI0004E11177|nr:Hcp family type VI secretion system effector [Maridesulfovibrio frigidus]
MALTSYMKVTGKTQGQIKGDCTQAGDKKDTMLIYAVEHNVEIPKDTHTGLPTGQRIHRPFTVTKHIDNASPKLAQACCKGEQLTVEIDHYRIDPTGIEKKYYTIKMEEAIIVNHHAYKPVTFLPDNKPYHDMEDISFTYSKITWTYADGNIEYTDDWKSS